ncbi:ROK family glucokinase [Christensenellaceae bacterium NSJ-44]|uniref:Glucokinase n=1 Tax=Luoshenia tenuis TaxID=2763654 RepID=A0A926CYP7_9FIRM|nr:ROK family glucokinase [Luoshenia tenuis]MBC8528166.1 ROK family glucokinase [Luoshenia tenuis]
MKYVGIDLGGTNIVAGIVDDEGKILCQVERPTGNTRPFAEVAKDMALAAVEAIEKAGLTPADVEGIGIGVPGAIDHVNGRATAVNLGWHMEPVRDEMQKVINLPIHMDNDGNAAALGEIMVGSMKGAKDAVFITLGTGVGGGLMVNGKMLRGAHSVAGEIGHMSSMLYGGVDCNCGQQGCWEKYTSATALIAFAREAMEQHPDCLIAQKTGGDKAKVNAKVVIDAAKEGDAVALKLFNDYAYALGRGIASLIHILDPEVVALGGGVSRAGDFLLDAVREQVKKCVMHPDMPYARVELATLGNEAGLIGAAMLCAEAAGK